VRKIGNEDRWSGFGLEALQTWSETVSLMQRADPMIEDTAQKYCYLQLPQSAWMMCSAEDILIKTDSCLLVGPHFADVAPLPDLQFS
jgi:hypothetical protein